MSSPSKHRARRKKKRDSRGEESLEEERRGMEEEEEGGGGGPRVVGFERPSLLQDLRNILQEYPDNGQIFKEMFQNAEDAGAREVKIISVTSPQSPQTRKPDPPTASTRPHGKSGKKGKSMSTSWRPPLDDMFSMPGLIVYNDALFTDEDWRGIRKLHDSVKVKDPLKVGRFGLGFKSVFHLTDHPIIVSNGQLLFMDPFREEQEAIFMTSLGQLTEEERQGLSRALAPLLTTLDPGTLTEQTFRGTAFWFPLREKASALSHTLYTHQRVQQLKQALRGEIGTMLLFLKKLEKIEIYACASGAPSFEFSVSLDEGCVGKVRQSRQEFISNITTPNKSCPSKEAYSYSRLRVQRRDSGVNSHHEDWAVVHFHQGLDDMSMDLRDLCLRNSLSHRPYVGVAATLNGTPDTSQGQIFSFLPLPPEHPSPTGLPLHVHGFFELSQNRCHVKWPTSEAENADDNGGPSDDSLLWNRLLVCQTLPKAYEVLLRELVQGCSHQGQLLTGTTGSDDMPALTADFLYTLWPSPDRVTSHWLSLLPTLYQTLPHRPLFFTPVKGGHWICLQEAVLMTSPAEDLDKATEAAVVQVYTDCEINLVRLPPHIMKGLTDRAVQQENDQSASITMVFPEHLSKVMKGDPRWSTTLSAQQKVLVLYYLSRPKDPVLVQDLSLIPMVDGGFCAWRDQQVYVCRTERDVRLLAGLRHQMCFLEQFPELQAWLQTLAHSGFGELKPVTGDSLPALLKVSLEREHGAGLRDITLEKNNPWIRNLWKYLQDQDLGPFDHLPLLPCPRDNRFLLRPLCGNYICERLKGCPSASSELSSALVHLGVEVIPSLPDFVLKHGQILTQRVQAPTYMGVLKTLATLSQKLCTDVAAVVNRFNAQCTVSERRAVVEILCDREVDTDPSWEAARPVLRRLSLFPVWPHMTEDWEFCSVEERGQMTANVSKDSLPPSVSFCPPLLYCAQQSTSHHRLAWVLGAKEISLQDLVKEVVSCLSSPHHTYTDTEVIQFMKYFILSNRFPSLTDLARNVCFVPSTSGKLCKASELYDPENQLLQNLLAGEDLFPSASFYQNTASSILGKLKAIGLRDVASVTNTHLISTARKIDELCSNSDSDFLLAERKARALWDFVQKYGQNYPLDVIQELAGLRCLPCMTAREAVPQDYPTGFPLWPESFVSRAIARPKAMCHHSDLKFVGSVKPVSLQMNDECVLRSFFHQPSTDDIIQHMEVLISSFEGKQSSKSRKKKKTKPQKHFAILLVDIFKKLCQDGGDHERVHEKIKNMACVMVDGQFHAPSELWVQEKNSNDILLSPYRYPLPSDLVDEDLVDFFVACGCLPRQDVGMLQQVLHEIHNKSTQLPPGHHSDSNDLTLVLRILRAIIEKGGDKTGETLLPVYSPGEGTVFGMEKAKLCTVAPDPNYMEDLVTEGEGLVLVHEEVEENVALALGALNLRARTMTGLDDLDMDDSSFGQYEPLTTRLHNLLKDGYTDGFSVPKELMQNADDAGAKVVKFLVDSRLNRCWRTGLLTPELADFQGPALWVFNDAQFTSTDFDHLCKLGGATKKEDCSKVGKFGLGFNAVYNLTDLPSVYSANTLAMLDPHERYLNSGRGKKMNFKILMNKLLLKRMRNQFQPFQGIFGCGILDHEWKPYHGTLFRFPFRTELQALKSDICKEAFTTSKQEDFVNGLQAKGGNLLLFLQHVDRLELYQLPADSPSPTDTQELMIVSRTLMSGRATPEGASILAHFSSVWKAAVDKGEDFEEEEVVELVKLSTKTLARDNRQQAQECCFCIAWAAGKEESCDIAREVREEGFVPLAAVALCVNPEGSVLELKSSPTGFYSTGHLFCFLPLAEEVSQMKLPVHINAPFALSSDRRGLLCETEDDRKSMNGRWNKALFSDPIPRAYLVCLQRVAQSEAQPQRQVYYNLWPQPSTHSSRTPQSALFPCFYRLLHEERFQVFLHHDGPVPFSRACFLDPDFRHKDIGTAAFQVLDLFWTSSAWRQGCLIDLPRNIATNITSSGPKAKKEFEKRIISEEQFFRDVLFPRIEDKHPDLQADDRNQLVLYALLSDRPELQELVQNHCCIPCSPDGTLNHPARLIHPKGQAAVLYHEEDGRFPRKEGDADFTRTHVLDQLLKLGMVKDKVSSAELVERARSVAGMASKSAGSQRARAIIKYLPSLGEDMLLYAQDLKGVPFLPSLQKPQGWPVSWFVDAHTDLDFVQPDLAHCEELRELVGCQAAVLEEKHLDLSPMDKETLEKLGVVVHRAKAINHGPQFTQLVVNNLLRLSEDVSQLSTVNTSIIHDICHQIYKYLNFFCEGRHSTHATSERKVIDQLKRKAVVWKNGEFLRADQLAFEPRDDLRPYLIILDVRSFHSFFQFLGVPQCFSVANILVALRRFRDDKPAELTRTDIELIRKMADLLPKALWHERKRPALEETETEDLHLPGQDMHLHLVGELCLDDCDWLSESGTMCFLHRDFSESLAHVFRVRTKREHDEDEFCKPFGQQEQLTTRINRLLEGYKRDASIFKELLQNADDAGASQVVFIKDFRQHSTDRLLNEGWKEVCGPALCVFNDATFSVQVVFIKDFRQHSTDRLLNEGWKEVCGPALCVFNDATFSVQDMAGIQALGEGSKEGDALKTGKYGVGFNAIYNLTDTPCFLTTVEHRPDDTMQMNEQQLGETMCVLDPNFFVVNRRNKLPGQRLSITDRFKKQYPNMLAPFDLGTITQGKMGTVFRLPLRTEAKVASQPPPASLSMMLDPVQKGSQLKSKIKQPAVHMREVKSLLRDFQHVLSEFLLFLSHLKQVSVYTAKKDGTFTLDYHTQLSTDESNAGKLQAFCKHVRCEAEKVKSDAGCPKLQEFRGQEVAMQCCLSDSQGKQEDWLVVHRFGLTGNHCVPQCLQSAPAVHTYRLLPLAGVAVCLSAPPQHEQTRVEAASQSARSSPRLRDPARTWRQQKTANEGVESGRADNPLPDADVQHRVFQAFCTLPLPVTTGLPVHVNARFALDHETRGNLYSRPDEDLSSWNMLLANDVIVPAYVTALGEIRSLCFAVEEECLHAESETQYEPGTSKRKWRKSSAQSDNRVRHHQGFSLRSSTDLIWKLDHYFTFFPQHKPQLDAFWNGLVTSFYQQLAHREQEAFPCVRKDLNRLLWVPASKSQGFPGHFCNLSNIELMDVLMKLNMNIIKCPSRIYWSFLDSEVNTVKMVQGKTVTEFLLSCDKSEADSCSLKNLPQPVQDTPFEAAENVLQVFSFIQTENKTTDLKNLPLSLRMSGDLQCFSSENHTIVSRFCDLLPESSKCFLHESLIKLTPIQFPDYLQRLDVRKFVQLLPYTLPQDTFGCGGIIPEHKLPFPSPYCRLSGKAWIRCLWQFLTSERLELLVNLLGQWSLLPSVRDKEHLLFPVEKKDEVVYIVEKRPVQMVFMAGPSLPEDQHNCSLEWDERAVNQCLEKLSAQLFKLHTGLLSLSCIAKEMVASVHNPKGLLTALTHPDLQPQCLLPLEAQNILDFFYRKLRPHVSNIGLLPFFERPDGTLTSVRYTNMVLCLPDSVPKNGLAKWSDRRKMCLLKTNFRLQDLFKMLRINMPTPSLFYSSNLLPSIADLPREAIPCHMKYIRDYLQPCTHDSDDLRRVLRETRFITGPDGTLFKASDFYDPDCKVFKVMLTEQCFPPAPYHSIQWKAFLRRIGLISKVSDDMFLRFAREVAEAGRKQLSQKVRQQSTELSKCLQTSDMLRGEHFLSQLKGLPFLLPQQPDQMQSGKDLSLIHSVFSPPTPLVSFSNSLSPKWVFLAWTTSCLVSDDSDPQMFQNWTYDMDDWIGFKRQPPKELVIKHVKNVCQSLGMKGPDNSSALTKFKDSTLEVVNEIMDAVYEHLSNFDEDDLKDLLEVCVVFNREKKSMFTGHQVVLHIVKDQVIEGYVVWLPAALGKFFPLFQKLGACEQVTADHYAKALKKIHAEFLEKFLDPNHLKLVSRAVDLLFRHLKAEENSTVSGPIYLPAVDITKFIIQDEKLVRLVDSRKILLEVNVGHQKRIKTPMDSHPVFTGFPQLGLKDHDLHREAKLLPEGFRMKEWHEVVKEVLQESCRTLAAQDECTQSLTSQLHSGACADVVKRIVNHKRLIKVNTFTEEDARKIEEGLKKITVFKVTNLQTILEMDGSPLPGTVESTDFFVTKDVKDDGNKLASIFINSCQESRITFGSRRLGFPICEAVSWVIDFEADEIESLLLPCLKNLAEAQQELDKRNVASYHIQQQRTVFPPPGSFVPDELHHLLDHDVYGFEVDEYVAYELYDPLLDTQDTDSEETGMDTEGTSDEEEEEEDAEDRTGGPGQSEKPIYIFAKVRTVLPPSTPDVDARTRLMLFHYIIDIGEEQTKEVQATELYKFVKPSLNVLVPYTGDTTPPTSAFTQPAGGDDLKTVLAGIRHQLKEIWRKFSDAQSRRRAVKRLLLKWHPDKNPGREEFCTKVFQIIQNYAALLEEGRELPSGDDDDVVRGDGDPSQWSSGDASHYRPFYRRRRRRGSRHFRGSGFNNFFDNIFSRGHSYAESSQSFSSRSGGGGGSGASFSSRTSTHANPQPEEGKRWMRQALQDLKAAKLTLRQGGEGLYNWACYQAHQMAEKALKAVLYQRDANNVLKYSHDICSLAVHVRDAQIQETITRLDGVVNFHTRMRYPDLLIFPKIPSDVYSQSEAYQACNLAEEVINRAQHLFDTYEPPPRQPSPPPPPPRQPSPPRMHHSAVAGSSRSSVDWGSRPSVSSASVAGQLQGPPLPKVPRLDPSIKALPPPP